jgi:hypothetical protein
MLYAMPSSGIVNSVIRITGIGDRDRPEWLIRISGMRSRSKPPEALLLDVFGKLAAAEERRTLSNAKRSPA